MSGLRQVGARGAWLALTALLAAFLAVSTDVGNVYGPLTGVMALLVWAQLTAGAPPNDREVAAATATGVAST